MSERLDAYSARRIISNGYHIGQRDILTLIRLLHVSSLVLPAREGFASKVRWINSTHTLRAWGRKARLDTTHKQKSAGLLPCCGKQSSQSRLSRLAGRAGMEVDDLAAQLFRRPLFLWQLKTCRNVKLNQFRHDTLLAGDPRCLTAFFRSHRKICIYLNSLGLSPISWSSKLSSTYRNTERYTELFAVVREKTQVSLSECAVWRKIICNFPAAPVRARTVATGIWTLKQA